MNWKQLTIIGLLLLAAAVVAASRYGGEVAVADRMRLAEVRSADFDITVHTLGVLDAAQSHMISSTIRGNSGKIIYLIEDGSPVEKGDLLVRLDPTPFEAEVHRLEGLVAGLQAAVEATEQLFGWEKSQVEQKEVSSAYEIKVSELELKRLEEGDGPLKLANFQDEMKKAGGEYERYRSYSTELQGLADEGFGNQAEIGRAKETAATYQEKYRAAKRNFESYRDYVLPSMIEAARAKVENARTAMEQSRQAGVHKVANAMAEVNKNRAKLKSVQQALKLAGTELAKTEIMAPFSGIVILYETFRDGRKRKPREGDTVIMNQPILYLPDISNFIVNTQVREIDLHKVSVGQGCTVRVDAYPDLLFEGEVSFIGSLASEQGRGQGGGKYFQVTLNLSGRDPRLRPGMSTRVIILSDRLKQVLSLPVAALFFEKDGTVCFRKSGTGFERVAVTVGQQNDELAQITRGLEPGDKVSLVRPSADQLN